MRVPAQGAYLGRQLPADSRGALASYPCQPRAFSAGVAQAATLAGPVFSSFPLVLRRNPGPALPGIPGLRRSATWLLVAGRRIAKSNRPGAAAPDRSRRRAPGSERRRNCRFFRVSVYSRPAVEDMVTHRVADVSGTSVTVMAP